MRLLYCYIKKYRNIREQEIPFDHHYKVCFDGMFRIRRNPEDVAERIVFGDSELKNLHILVGKTGAGKTNVLQLIGMPQNIRLDNSAEDDSYVLLYKEAAGFVAEIFNMEIEGFPRDEKSPLKEWERASERTKRHIRLMDSMRMFRFSCDENGKPEKVKRIRFSDTDGTYIFNGFDQNAFSECPYRDEREEETTDGGEWLGRIVSPYHRTALFFTCQYLKEYIDSFGVNNLKKATALEIRRDNWQEAVRIHLGDQLMKSDYWTFADRARKAEEVAVFGEQRDRKNAVSGKPEKKRRTVSVKNQFVHDLWTDYAIYLRKWIAYIQSYDENGEADEDFDDSGMQDLFQEYLDYHYEKESDGKIDPTQVPDYEKMSIVKRLEWLAQYIDRRGDGVARGLVWQIFTDIRDIGNILNQFDDKYFTNDKFTLPIVEMYTEKNRNLTEDLFERMTQYRPDDTGIFTRELLPYRFSCISSGEWQYAKTLGGLEEYCVKLSVGNKKPNLIYLMDEPETYMHPELCRKFLFYADRMLRKRAGDAQMQLIVSTHSPFILSDVLSGQVTRFDVNKEGYCIVNNDPDKRYFGANIHAILADGFFLKYTIGEYARVFLQQSFSWLREAAEKEQLTDEEERKLQELRSVVPQIGDAGIRRQFAGLGGWDDQDYK